MKLIQNKTIQRIGLFMIAGLFLNACNQSSDVEKKQAELQKKKIEAASLKSEIKVLETELEEQALENAEKTTAVNVQKIVPVSFTHSFEVNAALDPVEDAVVSPEMSGQISVVYVAEGDHVEKGQALAKLNTKVIESSIKEVKVALDLANQVYDKQQTLWNQKIGSEMDFLQARNAKESLEAKLNTLNTQMDMATVKAPISGVVDVIALKVGEMAMPGVVMMQLVNLSSFYIKADVAESHLATLKVGDEVNIEFPTYPAMNTVSKISRIGNIINPENRSFVVEVKLNNKNNKLKPNMLALTRFIDFRVDKAIVIPSFIIKNDFKGAYVYRAEQKDNQLVATKVYIETGLTMSDQTMVLKGIQQGDQIIVQGYDKVVNGSKIHLQESDN